MFCTSLRRRNSFASIIPALNGAPLSLKESHLETHDIEIPFTSSSVTNCNTRQPQRCLRVLLISSAGVGEAREEATLQRIRHFAALTGGEDLVIVLLLNTSPNPSLDSTMAPSTISNDNENSSQSAYALTQLQVCMINHPEIPHIPVLPLCKREAIKTLLQKHIAHLAHPLSVQPPLLTPLELLQQCTANPRMELQTAYVLSDLFPNLKELATACSNPSSLPGVGPTPSSQSLAGDCAEPGMSTSGSRGVTDPRLETLRTIVGDEAFQGIVDFWKEEWTID